MDADPTGGSVIDFARWEPLTTDSSVRPTTSFEVQVISGDCHPVSGYEVAATYLYRRPPIRRVTSRTDSEGRVVFDHTHSALPVATVVTVDGEIEKVSNQTEDVVVEV